MQKKTEWRRTAKKPFHNLKHVETIDQLGSTLFFSDVYPLSCLPHSVVCPSPV